MDFLNSFFQNIKDKLTNPFFGTLTFILIFHHWEFWYTLFNFDSECTRTEKVAILRNLANTEFGGHRLLLDVLGAFGLMIVGYLIIILTRTLSLAIEFGAMPSITGKVTSDKVIDKATYDSVLSERNEYSEKYEQQRQLVRNYSKDYDSQLVQIETKNQQLSNINTEISLQNNNITNLNDQIASLNTDIVKHKKESLDNEAIISRLQSDNNELDLSHTESLIEKSQFRNIFFSDENLSFWNSKDKYPPTIVDLVERLKKDAMWDKLKRVAEFERRAGVVPLSFYTDLEPYGLVFPGKEKLTPLGSILAFSYEIFDK